MDLLARTYFFCNLRWFHVQRIAIETFVENTAREFDLESPVRNSIANLSPSDDASSELKTPTSVYRWSLQFVR